jgi:transposase
VDRRRPAQPHLLQPGRAQPDHCRKTARSQQFSPRQRVLQQLKVSRRELYQTLDKPALKALPSSPYEYAQWSTAGVNIDYHIVVNSHFYSVPYQLAKERVEIRLTDSMVEVLFKNRRVAAHPRSYEKGRYTTLLEHMPKSHQMHLEWSPSRITRWAEQNGPQTKQLVTLILESKPHPEQGYRSCLGIIRLAKTYSPERLEAACARAIQIGARSYKSVKSILSSGLDQSALPGLSSTPATSIQHENVRGKGYFSEEAPHA